MKRWANFPWEQWQVFLWLFSKLCFQICRWRYFPSEVWQVSIGRWLAGRRGAGTTGKKKPKKATRWHLSWRGSDSAKYFSHAYFATSICHVLEGHFFYSGGHISLILPAVFLRLSDISGDEAAIRLNTRDRKNWQFWIVFALIDLFFLIFW